MRGKRLRFRQRRDRRDRRVLRVPLKVEIRCDACRGQTRLFAARTYPGQATHFRTPGGGFAPVLTLLEPA